MVYDVLYTYIMLLNRSNLFIVLITIYPRVFVYLLFKKRISRTSK